MGLGRRDYVNLGILALFVVALIVLFGAAGWGGAAHLVVFLAVVTVIGIALRLLLKAARR